jgi:hypothetical protein
VGSTLAWLPTSSTWTPMTTPPTLKTSSNMYASKNTANESSCNAPHVILYHLFEIMLQGTLFILLPVSENTSLVLSSASSGSSEASLFGVVVWSWRRAGAGSRFRVWFCIVVESMAFEGRLLDLGDQIHCVRWFFFLAASRWW